MNWLDTVFIFSSVCLCVTSSPAPTAGGTVDEVPAECPSICVFSLDNNIPTTEEEIAMTSIELNPHYYQASRAGNAIQHYLNTLHGSPFRVYGDTQVHKATVEDMAEAGMKYVLEFSVKDWVNESQSSEGQLTAEIIYPRDKRPPEVQGSWDGLPQFNTSAKEQEFYQRYSAPASAVSAEYIPDSYGNMEPEMKPFWHLGRVASSFIMLNESSENTLYNMAQVAKITQLQSEDDQLRFDYEVLLHDMVSQGIIRWKLLVSWSPTTGVKVLQKEMLPRCQCKSKTNPE